MWHETGLRSLVTCLARSPADWDTFAVGYADGSIRIWSALSKSVTVTFNGHKSAISSLAWDKDGTRLASGSKDTDIIMWDVVGEVGLFRLRGHRDQITGLAFVAAPVEEEDEATDEAKLVTNATRPATHLLSSSKDTFIKLFNLATQHCVETVVGHRGEAWSFAYDAESSVLISGGGEGEVKCWKVDGEVLTKGAIPAASGKLRRAIYPLAALTLSTQSHTHNITQISLHPTLPVLAIHSGEKTIDVFRLRTEEELRKKLARRRRRDREKKKEAADKGKGKQVAEDEGLEDESDEVEWRDRLAVWSVIRAGGKIKSFCFAPDAAKNKGDVQVRCYVVVLSHADRSRRSWPHSRTTRSRCSICPQPRRPSPPRSSPSSCTRSTCPAIAPTSELFASRPTTYCSPARAAGRSKSGTSRRPSASARWTAATPFAAPSSPATATYVSFPPVDYADRPQIVVGTKSGELLLYDLSSSSLLETIAAHTGPIWSLHVRPDGRGLVTGSADKDVKFWDFEVKEVAAEVADGAKTRVLTMAHTKTLKMTDDVLAVKHSPDGRLLAVSLLDSTVKVFYTDTLKFFLSLYGHKVRRFSLLRRADACTAPGAVPRYFGRLEAHHHLLGGQERQDLGSRLWGLSSLALCARGEHHAGRVREGNALLLDRFQGQDAQVLGRRQGPSHELCDEARADDWRQFECIQKLEGHHGEIWALAVSHRGKFVVTGSHDKSIRIWEKTEEAVSTITDDAESC